MTRGWRKIASPGDLEKDVVLGDARFDGKELLVIGGLSKGAGSYSPVALSYDPSLDSWRKLPSPPHLHFHSRFVAGALYAFSTPPADDVDHPMSIDVYDPAVSTWSTLPDAPIVDRFGASVVWSTTTNELLVWGGTRSGWKGEDGYHLEAADGAAWNPSTKTWRKLAPSPLGPQFTLTSVWDGRHLVIAHGGRSFPGEGVDGNEPVSRAAMYDPKDDTWTMLCDPPVGKRIARFGTSIGAAGELGVFWGGWAGYGGDGDGPPDFQDGSIFDSIHRMWRALPAPPIAGEWDLYTARWSAGGKLYAWGLPIAPGLTGGVVFDPTTNEWTVIDDLWGPPTDYDTIASWTGCDLFMRTAKGWAALRP